MMDNLEQFFSFMSQGGWMAIAGAAIFFTYKTSIVGIITLGVYKGMALFVSRSGDEFEKSVANLIGEEFPLSVDTKRALLDKLKK